MVSSQDGPKGQTCAEDDRVGSPCGQGGICTDLWSFGGPEGSYMCECNEGYEETTTDTGKPTCTRAFCRSKPGETDGTQQSEPNSVHFGLTASWKCKEGFLWTAYQLSRKIDSRQRLPSGQLDESVQNDCVDTIMSRKSMQCECS